jgi:hypothetical protein
MKNPTSTATRPRAILVHGFNVRDKGAGSIDKLGSYLEARAFRIQQFDYGWLFLLGVRMKTRKHARRLAAMSQPGDVAVGHSNGCNLIVEAAWRGARFKRVVFINPALDADTPLPPQIDRCDVWHSPSDQAVRFARFLWFHPWGNMGAIGYVGNSKRYRNFNKETGFERSSDSHSDVFSDSLLPYFGPKIVDALDDPLPEKNS